MNRLLLLSFAFLPAVTARTQSADITGVITKGEVTPVKIALDTADAELRGVIENDLKLTGYFAIVSPATPASMPAPPANSTNAALVRHLTEWQSLGVDQLLKVTVRSASPLSVDYFLYDCVKHQLASGRNLSGTAAQKRWLGHTVSDEVLMTLWGITGIARSHLVAVQPSGKAKEIVWMDYDGQGNRAVTANYSTNLRPSAVGTDVVYVSFSQTYPEIRIIQGGKTRTLYGRGEGLNSSPAFSPDGKRVYFTSNREGNPEIYAISTDGAAAPQRLTQANGIDTEPAPSPDGKSLAFVSDRGGRPAIWLMDVGGASPRSLGLQGSKQFSPNFSPDGKYLAYTALTEGGSQEIFIYEMEAGKSTQVTTGYGAEEPCFAPDSRHFVFTSTKSGRPQTYLAAIDGSIPVTQITSGPGAILPAFVR